MAPTRRLARDGAQMGCLHNQFWTFRSSSLELWSNLQRSPWSLPSSRWGFSKCWETDVVRSDFLFSPLARSWREKIKWASGPIKVHGLEVRNNRDVNTKRRVTNCFLLARRLSLAWGIKTLQWYYHWPLRKPGKKRREMCGPLELSGGGQPPTIFYRQSVFVKWIKWWIDWPHKPSWALSGVS